MRAGLARVTHSEYQPFPTVYDALFPGGTMLTAPTRPPQRPKPVEAPKDDSPPEHGRDV